MRAAFWDKGDLSEIRNGGLPRNSAQNWSQEAGGNLISSKDSEQKSYKLLCCR